MTDDKSKDSGKATDPAPQASAPGTPAQAESNFTKAAHEKGAAADKKTAAKKDTATEAKKASGSGGKGGKRGASRTGKRGFGWLWLLILIVLLGAGGTWAWLNWPQVQNRLAPYLEFIPGFKRESTAATPASAPQTAAATAPETQPGAEAPAATAPAQQPAATETATQQVQAVDRATRQSVSELREQLRQQQGNVAELRQQIAELQRNVTAQGNRLGELGNASREDWQLAEADYLLRLANQRLMLERDSRAALGLVEEVDQIVRRVNLPDLYGVRQQLARDITALKLVDNIDREGLYLRLRALEEQLLRTDIQPKFDLATLDASIEPEETETKAGQSAWQRSWQHFTQFVRDSVRIRDGNIDPVLLSPQSEARFRQSLRLNMEQAELALLREDSTVYKDALSRARKLLLEYGTDTRQRDVLAKELQEMAQEPIAVELPSLSASQSALHNYIERLHKLDNGNQQGANSNGGEQSPGSGNQ
ncbi:uroporphyrinogen-III C-methyltransferase [Microbulbifer sp. SAOS-129_SWC]|uniref:uroporphyrinogen-III C-methyltransferase n=1 Tax=Microbulbifer sp. SAOS-129_SWC TaxID=3145235 RepID=UPI003217C45E